MVRFSLFTAVSTTFSVFTHATYTSQSRSFPISFQDKIVAEAGGVQNIHIRYNQPLNGELSIHYGPCDAKTSNDTDHRLGTTYVGNHELAKRHEDHPEQRPTRFVWIAPNTTASGGCLHAFSDRALVGRSVPVSLAKRKERRWTAAADVMDAEGPWFDGVETLKEKEPDAAFVAAHKAKKIGIIGAGMSGLMTAHLLDSVGFHNWEIIEATNRLGGRLHTVYFENSKPSDYFYQEIGAMRFPVSIQYPGTNETFTIHDSQLVFQLANELNKQNKNNTQYAVKFYKWIQDSANVPAITSKRRPDGTIPGETEVADNPDYQDDVNATYSDPVAVANAQNDLSNWNSGFDEAQTKLYADSIYKAHKQAIKDGYFDYSEAGYLNYVKKYSKNVTDEADSFDDVFNSFDFEDFYFDATEWHTIDQGVSRLPLAFGPQVLNRTMFNTSIQGMTWDKSKSKITFQYRSASDLMSKVPQSLTYDYAVVTVPFSRVRLWRLPPYSGLLTRAINGLNYAQVCKVALAYKTRFWEHLEHPIIGGCGAVNIPGIENICYPSYKLNSTGPGAILGSYVTDAQPARAVAALTEQEHIALVQRAMVETHGDVAAEQWTGDYVRKCWEQDEFQGGGWAQPLVGQQDLYLPAYFHTEFGTVFVGEHTSYTHAWVWSALESAVRGTAQLLLDMGMVDEAKQIVGFWMARWIHI